MDCSRLAGSKSTLKRNCCFPFALKYHGQLWCVFQSPWPVWSPGGARYPPLQWPPDKTHGSWPTGRIWVALLLAADWPVCLAVGHMCFCTCLAQWRPKPKAWPWTVDEWWSYQDVCHLATSSPLVLWEHGSGRTFLWLLLLILSNNYVGIVR